VPWILKQKNQISKKKKNPSKKPPTKPEQKINLKEKKKKKKPYSSPKPYLLVLWGKMVLLVCF
jgi:hypothetical protein